MKNKAFLISMTVLWGMVFGSAMHSLTMGICMGLMIGIAFGLFDSEKRNVRRHFNKALCLSAADPFGEPVSHCSLWFHQDTDYAYVEPVCTIPGYRGKGIAAALLSETFSRAKALGAKKAYVISDLPFYEKLGFEKTQHYSFYRKA